MKIDDLIAADNQGTDLDGDLVLALSVYGFTYASYTLYQNQPRGDYVGAINAQRPDGTGMTWLGHGLTPEDAYLDAVDGCAKWILNQNIPAVP